MLMLIANLMLAVAFCQLIGSPDICSLKATASVLCLVFISLILKVPQAQGP